MFKPSKWILGMCQNHRVKMNYFCIYEQLFNRHFLSTPSRKVVALPPISQVCDEANNSSNALLRSSHGVNEKFPLW